MLWLILWRNVSILVANNVLSDTAPVDIQKIGRDAKDATELARNICFRVFGNIFIYL